MGVEHADTMDTMGQLAHLYKNQGRYDEARVLFSEYYELQCSKFGEKHPNVMATKRCIEEVDREKQCVLYCNQCGMS